MGLSRHFLGSSQRCSAIWPFLGLRCNQLVGGAALGQGRPRITLLCGAGARSLHRQDQPVVGPRLSTPRPLTPEQEALAWYGAGTSVLGRLEPSSADGVGDQAVSATKPTLRTNPPKSCLPRRATTSLVDPLPPQRHYEPPRAKTTTTQNPRPMIHRCHP